MKNRFAIPLLIVLGTLSCVDSPTAPSLNQYQRYIDIAKDMVQKNRGLSFKRPVHMGIMTRNEYAEFSTRYSSLSNSSYITKEFQQIGFIPENFNDQDFNKDFDDDFAGAFYIPGTDSLYIIDADQIDESDFIYYLIHEYTHALQEQHFNGLSRYVTPAYNQSAQNSDFYLSYLFLAEGDASFTSDAAMFEALNDNSRMNYLGSIYTMEIDSFYINLNKQEIPRYLRIRGYSPYIIGRNFIKNIYQQRQWSGVNRLYHSERVNSVRDILTESSEIPYVFDFSSISKILLENTFSLDYADDDTYGAIMLMALLNEYVTPAECKKAFGLIGDRLMYTLKNSEKYGSFVWAFKFKTTEDATAVTTKLDALLTARTVGGTKPTRTLSGTDTLTFANTAFSTTLIQSNTFVYWLENVPKKDLILKSLPNTTQVLAKSDHNQKNYSTISFNEKKKFIRKLIGE
jgi:hypothetical protein